MSLRSPLITAVRARARHLRAYSAIALLATLSMAPSDALAQDGAAWDTVFQGAGLDNSVNALAVDNHGNLYAAGTFTTAGGQPASRIAMWDGAGWTALGSGLTGGIKGAVHALAVDDAGNLYAAGSFTSAGGITAANIAKWNGTSWSALGTGLNAVVYALAVDDSGNLYAGGNFTQAGETAVNRIAKWDGTGWSALGAGLGTLVQALALDADGNLYAGGSFSTAAIQHVAVWDGTTWSSLGSGVSSAVRAFAIEGDVLYAGGDFSIAGDAPAQRVAQWDGTTWTSLSTETVGSVHALAVDKDGNLYAGGDFTILDGQEISRIARWDGERWSGLGSGMDQTVKALAVRDVTVFAGGDFTTAGGLPSPHIARWSLPAGSHPADPLPVQPVANVGTVALGQTFSVSVEVGTGTAPVSNLFGAGFALHFDPTLFQASTATAGAFLDNGDLIVDATIDNAEGTVHFSVTRKRGATGVGGHGTVARIDFTTIHDGAPLSATFSLSDVMLIDPEGTKIPAIVQLGEIEITTYAVWPGDTDNDGDADINDVLPIGIHFGATGPARSDTTFAWKAQTAQPWVPETAMYADATGDGIVNQNDILPIGVNFGLNRATIPDAPALLAASDPLASLRIPALPVGERFTALLSLEAGHNTVAELLGYAAELSVPASLKVTSHPGTLLENGDLLSLSQSNGPRYYVAHTRKGTAGPVTGHGPLLELSFEVIAPMSGPSNLTLDALSLGTPGGVVAADHEIRLALTSSLAVPNEPDVPVTLSLHGSYPNPFTTRAAITFDLPEDAHITLTMYDVLGREVENIDAGTLAAGTNRRIEIDGTGLASGSYVYRLRAELPQGPATLTGRLIRMR